jgi:site-specific DNA-methyltransferase (cytosine-N4-specific)
MNKVYWGDCRDSMRIMAKEGIKVQTCITSPPYYGLRDYGTGTWIGGDETCSHKRDSKYSAKTITGHANKDLTVGDAIYKTVCPKCGAIRKDLQIGLEETPQEFIDNLVEVFACVWDILADDGTLWVNLGDTYSAGGRGAGSEIQNANKGSVTGDVLGTWKVKGYRPKNLLGMPWRLAFALQDFGWNLRQDIIWHKPNPMPESVTDRCTKAHEYFFLLSKSQKYYFDHKAIKEPLKGEPETRNKKAEGYQADYAKGDRFSDGERVYGADGMANKRSVWTVNTSSYKGAHFATYPIELIEPCILAGSRVGDIVLDPFFGSGTTGQAAQNLGRKWIGCELNKTYEKLQNGRIAQGGLEL